MTTSQTAVYRTAYILLVLATPLGAASLSWVPGSEQAGWSVTANWSGLPALQTTPLNGDSLTFMNGGAGLNTTTDDLSALDSLAGLTVSGSSTWTILIENSLTINGISNSDTAGVSLEAQGETSNLSNTILTLTGTNTWTQAVSSMTAGGPNSSAEGFIQVGNSGAATTLTLGSTPNGNIALSDFGGLLLGNATISGSRVVNTALTSNLGIAFAGGSGYSATLSGVNVLVNTNVTGANSDALLFSAGKNTGIADVGNATQTMANNTMTLINAINNTGGTFENTGVVGALTLGNGTTAVTLTSGTLSGLVTAATANNILSGVDYSSGTLTNTSGLTIQGTSTNAGIISTTTGGSLTLKGTIANTGGTISQDNALDPDPGRRRHYQWRVAG